LLNITLNSTVITQSFDRHEEDEDNNKDDPTTPQIRPRQQRKKALLVMLSQIIYFPEEINYVVFTK